MKKLKTAPVWIIICGSLFFVYLIFFVRMVFFHSSTELFFPQYVPVMNAPGLDLSYMLSYAAEFLKGGTPYIGFNNYPPLASVLFCPLTALPFKYAYLFVTLLSIAMFISVVLVLPLASCEKPDTAALVALTIAGLLSSGFLFELAQGQFNVIAMACCAWAIFLFHAGHGKWSRFGAYLLFSVAIQLKLYPAVFIFAFARDARDLKGNVVRWIALGAANTALLFALGPSVFRDFLTVMTSLEKNNFIWCGNHSIKCLAAIMQNTGLPRVSFLELGCTLLLAACFAVIMTVSYVRNIRASFKYLITVCALSAMLIPSISHDYKLPILSMAFAVFVGETGPVRVNRFRCIIMAVLLCGLSMLYGCTLFYFSFKPMLLMSNTPVLLFACIILVCLMLTEESRQR
jgi:hypothetical protein